MAKYLLIHKLTSTDVSEPRISQVFINEGFIADPSEIGRKTSGKAKDAKSYSIKLRINGIVLLNSNSRIVRYSKRGDVRLNGTSGLNLRANDFLAIIADDKQKIESESIVDCLVIKPNDKYYSEISINYSGASHIMDYPFPALNTILYGPPGTGKTYSTIEHSLKILGVYTKTPTIDEKDIEDVTKFTKFLQDKEKVDKRNTEKFRSLLGKRIFFVTMHPSYSYEDFIEGLRPLTGGANKQLKFDYKPGILKHIIDKKIKEKTVLILDEINRANISKVFGELITSIEDDKREGEKHYIPIRLPSGKLFSVPSNLYIIGTMNTADKSISLVDIALRRRFQFILIPPESDIILRSSEADNKRKAEALKKMNSILLDSENKKLYKGLDFQIGHAYFLKNNPFEQIINENIIPLLVEYYRNDLNTVSDFMEKMGWKNNMDGDYRKTGIIRYKE